MAYTVTEIDKYLKGHKYDFYQLITKGWGAKDKDVIEIKNLWQDAEDAVGTNSKLDKFKKLQEKLNPFFDRAKDRLKKDEETLKENDALSFPDPIDQADHDFDKSLVKFADWPKANKFENLTLEDAYGDEDGGKPYDIEQMTKLAEQYGYDYRDKDERREFLSYVSKANQNRALEKIWNDGGDALYTSLVTPIAKEYAQKNYEKINPNDYASIGPFGIPTDPNMLATVAGDVGVGTLMAGTPGAAATKLGANKVVAEVANNLVAPVARQNIRMLYNDVSPEEAIKEGIAEAATNYATPYALRGSFRWGNRVLGNETKMNVQSRINEMASKARSVSKKLKEGQPWMEAQYGDIGDGTTGVIGYTFKRLNKNGQIEEITAEQFGKFKHRISEKEMGDFGDFMQTMRGKRTDQERALAKDWTTNPEVNFDPEYGIEKKMRQSSLQGKDPISDLNLAELSTLQKEPPKESFWNFAKTAPLTEAGLDYFNNQLGRTKYGGSFINSVSMLDPTDTVRDILKVSPKVDQNDPEVKMYKRNYILHQANPDLVDMPKKPEKYKDFSIEEIFGE